MNTTSIVDIRRMSREDGRERERERKSGRMDVRRRDRLIVMDRLEYLLSFEYLLSKEKSLREHGEGKKIILFARIDYYL